jgi:hypothetical protein
MTLLKFAAPDSDMAVVLEDDDRTGYAYLLRGERIVGDVWLYNVLEPPMDANWPEQAEMPFLNPAPFCIHAVGPIRLTELSQVTCEWRPHGHVQVNIDGVPWASLAPGLTPGYSRNARRPNPVAKPLSARS